MKTLLPLILLPFLLTGCANGYGRHSSSLNKVSLGMSKAEVITLMGPPARVSAQSGVEYLIYPAYTVAFGPYEDHFVRIIDGKAESYGKMGDFNGAQPYQGPQVIYQATPAPAPRIEMPKGTYTPMQISTPKPQTNCTSTRYGNTVHTNCN